MGVLLWLFLIIIIVALISPIIFAIIQFGKKKPNAMNSHLNFDFREIRFGAKKDILKFDGNFVAIDCETTGLTKKDEIIEIGIVKYENMVIKLSKEPLDKNICS